MSFQLFAGQRLTVISIGSLGMTYKRLIQVKRVFPTEIRQKPLSLRSATYTMPPKRTEYYLDLPVDGSLIFDGWDTPVGIDGDSKLSRVFANGCLNLCGNLETIREWIDTKALNHISDYTKALCLHWDETGARIGSPTVIYPNGPIFDSPASCYQMA